MHKQWEDLMPFYLNRTLLPGETQALEQHLARCAACRQILEEWRVVADATYLTANDWSQTLPPLRIFDTVPVRVQPTMQRPRYLVAAIAAVVLLFLLTAGVVFFAFRPIPESRVAVMSTETPSPIPTTPFALFITATNKPTETPVTRFTPVVPTAIIETGDVSTPLVEPTALPSETFEFDLMALSTDEATSEVFETSPRIMSAISEDCYVYNRSQVPVSLLTEPDGEVVSTLEPETGLSILSIDEHGWYEVLLDDRHLWVQQDTVELEGKCDRLFITPTWTPTPTPVFFEVISIDQTQVLLKWQVEDAESVRITADVLAGASLDFGSFGKEGTLIVDVSGEMLFKLWVDDQVISTALQPAN